MATRRWERARVTVSVAFLALALSLAASVAAAAAGAAGARADLTVHRISNPPAHKRAGEQFTVRDRVANVGGRAAPRTRIAYHLSRDRRRSRDDAPGGSHGVPPLKPGKSAGGLGKVSIPGGLAPGIYMLLACADGSAQVREKREGDNCRVAQRSLRVSGGDPPPTVSPPAPAPVAQPQDRGDREAADAQTETGEASKSPWTGWWWPLRDEKDPNLFDDDGPIERYWRYIHATRGPNTPPANPKQVEKDEHSCGGACAGVTPRADWCGHCHAWTAAAMREPEPTKPLTKTITYHLLTGDPPADTHFTETVEFRVGDLKGLLTELWWSFRTDKVGDGIFVTPRAFHDSLRAWIRADVAFDKDSKAAVWNYPIARYETTSVVDGKDATIRHYTTKLWYVEPDKDPSYVGTTLGQVTYKYRLKVKGAPDDGAWKSAEPPGLIWRPLPGEKAKPSPGNEWVKRSCVDEVIKEGTVAIDVGNAHPDKPWRKWECP